MKLEILNDKNRELRNKEMERFYFYSGLSSIIGVILVLILMISFNALQDSIDTEIIMPEKFPMNIEISGNSSLTGSYYPVGIEPFDLIPVNNLSDFENNRIDIVRAIAGYDRKTEKFWLLIRGKESGKSANISDCYKEFEKPPIEFGFLYRISYLHLKESKIQTQPFSSSSYCNSCHSGTMETKYKTLSIEFSQEKSFADSISIAIFAGLAIATFAFIILMSRSKKKT